MSDTKLDNVVETYNKLLANIEKANTDMYNMSVCIAKRVEFIRSTMLKVGQRVTAEYVASGRLPRIPFDGGVFCIAYFLGKKVSELQVTYVGNMTTHRPINLADPDRDSYMSTSNRNLLNIHSDNCGNGIIHVEFPTNIDNENSYLDTAGYNVPESWLTCEDDVVEAEYTAQLTPAIEDMILKHEETNKTKRDEKLELYKKLKAELGL